MSAKPYSPGHIGAVAGNYTQMRISGSKTATCRLVVRGTRSFSAANGIRNFGPRSRTQDA